MRLLSSLATAALTLFAAAAPAFADHMKVRIHNDTGLTLYRFYSTNSGATKWGSDVMGSSVLANGSSMVLNFDNAKGYCMFDFRAIFDNGVELTRANVNVCEIGDYYYQP
jgi:hypothetical protein